MNVRLIIIHPNGYAKLEPSQFRTNTEWAELLRNVKKDDYIRMYVPESFGIPSVGADPVCDENHFCRLQVVFVEIDATSKVPCLYIYARTTGVTFCLANEWVSLPNRVP